MTTKNIIGIETKRRFKVVDTIDDLEKLANQKIIKPTTSKVIQQKIEQNNYSGKSMDEMVDYFISKGKDYRADSIELSLEELRLKKGETALIMTFAEGVKKYNKTGENFFNTTDNVYFRLQTDEGKKIINLSGTGVSIPQNYGEALKIYAELKNNQYNNTSIEVLIGDDINTKNATQHTFAVIINDKLESSGWYKNKNWCNNTFVKFMNGGKSGLEELAKGYDYSQLGSIYHFKKSDNEKFEVGCPVLLEGGSLALNAYDDSNYAKFRG